MQVQIAGLGALCANGLSPETIYDSCLKGESSVQSSGLSSLSAESFAQLRQSIPEKIEFQSLRQSKSSILSFHSLRQALNDAHWSPEEISKAGFIFATTTGKIDLWEKTLFDYNKAELKTSEYDQALANQPLGAPFSELSQAFKLNGPKVQISSSCSASLQALAMGFLWVQSGQVEKCIVGSTEIHSDLTRIGFNSLRLLTKDVCKPFDKNRTGINLGEGSAFLCLEKASVNKKTNWGFISGAGLSSDAFHPTAPHSDGRGSQVSMQKALEFAKLPPNDIDWIYAHGTGSPANDLAEAHAIKALFKHSPFVTSTKSIHGHTLGTSGALEAVIGLLSMKNQTILPNAFLTETDPVISLNLPKTAVQKNFSHFLKNSLGFGGINVSLIFSKGELHS